MVDGFRCPNIPLVPDYSDVRRELRVGHFLLRAFAREAWNQIAVLQAFQSLQWPSLIESPFGRRFDPSSLARAWKTVFRLNHDQDTRLVRFRSRSVQRTISWEFRIPLKGS